MRHLPYLSLFRTAANNIFARSSFAPIFAVHVFIIATNCPNFNEQNRKIQYHFFTNTSNSVFSELFAPVFCHLPNRPGFFRQPLCGTPIHLLTRSKPPKAPRQRSQSRCRKWLPGASRTGRSSIRNEPQSGRRGRPGTSLDDTACTGRMISAPTTGDVANAP